MKKNLLIMLVIFIFILLPISVNASGKIVCGGNDFTAGDTISCEIKINNVNDFTANSFESEVVINDTKGKETDKLVVESFDNANDGYGGYNKDVKLLMLTLMPEQSGSYSIGTLKVKVNNDIKKDETFQLSLNNAKLLSGDTENNEFELGTLSSMLHIKKKTNEEPKTEEPKSEEPKNDKPTETTQDPAPSTPTPAQDNKVDKNAGTVPNNSTSKGNSNGTYNYNPNTGNVSIAVVGILLIVSLITAFYIFNKRRKTDM